MVTLTPKAATVIRALAGRPGVPSGAGVRIDTGSGDGSLTIAVAPSPVDGDQVLEDDGARLFVGASAVPFLNDKTVDASVDASGGVQFTVGNAPR